MVAASTGNHGQGLAYAGARLGVAVTICVPVGNNPEKNAAIRALGATVIEEGRDYDEATEVVGRSCVSAADARPFHQLPGRRGRRGHAHPGGAAAHPELDAMVIASAAGRRRWAR